MKIKFRYIIQDGDAIKKIFVTIEETEKGFGISPDKKVIARSQFIGMEDCNGEEIYEGDILEWTAKNETKRGEVKYNYQGCVCHINYDDKGKHYYKEFSATFGSDIYRMDTVEVVGNIYENSLTKTISHDNHF